MISRRELDRLLDHTVIEITLRLPLDDLSPFFDLICEYHGADLDRSPEFFDRFVPYLSVTQLALCPRDLNARRVRQLPKC
jgi:hypothetical protein